MAFSEFPITSFTFILEGIFLSVFGYNRYKEYTRVPNIITRQYWLASFFVSTALFVYGIPALITDSSQVLSVCAGIALIINAIGFSHFFLIPMSGWFRLSTYVLIKYGLFLSVVLLAVCLILIPPTTMIESGIIHWRFGSPVDVLAAIHMDLAFMLNIVLIGMHYYRLKRFSAVNATLLIITFALTGLGGTYQYIGDSPMFLVLSSISLCAGIGSVFFSVVRGNIAKILNWQYDK